MLGSVPPGVTSERLSKGAYRVHFPRPLAGCVLSASASTEGDWFFPSTTVLVSAFEGNSLTVLTGHSTDSSFQDRDFSVTVICPA